MRHRNLTTLAVLFAAGIAVMSGCAVDGNETVNNDPQSTRPASCFGKCDGPNDGIYQSPYEVDLEAVNELWPGAVEVTKVTDLFSVVVKLQEGVEFTAPTHLFGAPVNVIPYSNEDGVTDADGEEVPRGDEMIAKIFPPGRIGFAIKHHRPEYRELSALGSSPSAMKEHLKLQDTHIELVIGVERDGKPGAITVNNPQNYENGHFGTPHYPMIFVKPEYPEYLSPSQRIAFNDNIRTMALGFNAVSTFPGDYNGGDPLAANSPAKVREHAIMMVRAITGDATALDFFEDPANKLYCAELAFVAASAGMIMPLNRATMEPLVGPETWDAFVAEVEAHNAGEPSAFVEMNDNKRVALVKLALAPEDLYPAPEYAPEEIRTEESQRLAFEPMTMADIVDQFLRTHVPRESLGESLAPAQGALLTQMKPGLLEAMGLDSLPEDHPKRMAVEQLFQKMVAVVATPHEDYSAFRANLEPLLEQARMMTGPTDDTGSGLFVPPSLLHVTAQGKMTDRLLGLKYLGHGLHYSVCRRKETPVTPEPEPEEPVVEPDEPFAGSCTASCGGAAPDGSCFCDEICVEYGDCCADYEEHCDL